MESKACLSRWSRNRSCHHAFFVFTSSCAFSRMLFAGCQFESDLVQFAVPKRLRGGLLEIWTSNFVIMLNR